MKTLCSTFARISFQKSWVQWCKNFRNQIQSERYLIYFCAFLIEKFFCENAFKYQISMQQFKCAKNIRQVNLKWFSSLTLNVYESHFSTWKTPKLLCRNFESSTKNVFSLGILFKYFSYVEMKDCMVILSTNMVIQSTIIEIPIFQ